ncbi:hypothetical protein SEA_BRUHMOMENT_89 [Arthrobacter phage BruhMoment]|nr:hypothetical protein SEA_BRUHMOMENT_89 [Arthrobacter phage BruhMoment]
MPKIEIDLADLGLPTGMDHEGEPTGAKTLQDLIVEAAANKLLADRDESVYEMRDRIRREYNTRITERVEEMITEAFNEPIQRTTRWGETQGEVTTIKEIIRESIEKYMNGTTPSRNGYSTDPVSLTQLIDNEVRMIINKEMQAHITKVKGEIKLEVQKKALAAAIAELSK